MNSSYTGKDEMEGEGNVLERNESIRKTRYPVLFISTTGTLTSSSIVPMSIRKEERNCVISTKLILNSSPSIFIAEERRIEF